MTGCQAMASEDNLQQNWNCPQHPLDLKAEDLGHHQIEVANFLEMSDYDEQSRKNQMKLICADATLARTNIEMVAVNVCSPVR